MMDFDEIWKPKYLGEKKFLGPECFFKNQSHGDMSIAHIFCVIRAISSDPGEYLCPVPQMSKSEKSGILGTAIFAAT